MPSLTSQSTPPSTPPSTQLKYKLPNKEYTYAPKKPELTRSLLKKFHNKITYIQRIGDKSANGFVAKVTTEQEDLKTIINEFTEEYKEHFILKSVQREDNKYHQKNDNPMYEFEAGLFINTQLLYFPCFLRTYTLFYYDERNRTKELFMNYLKKYWFDE